jgi:septal ring factor EnvC (AmiA/AmiB activator)
METAILAVAGEQLGVAVITTICTVFASLLVTFIFNKVSGLPAEMKKQKKAQQDKIDELDCNLNKMNTRLAKVEESVSHYPEYREQSLKIQGQLKEADNAIVDLCKEIKDDVIANRQLLDERLKSLESREKNSLRAKILNEYRLYTDEHKNPKLA